MRVVVSILLAFGVLAAAWALHAYDQRRDESYFKAALAAAHANERVEIAGLSYEVALGEIASTTTLPSAERLEIVRLTYEKTLARRSPLLGLPGTDTETLRIASAQLQRTAEKLSARQASKEEAAAVAQALYPTGFLYALAALEEARRTFLESGARADADTYTESLDRALAAFASDLSAFEHAFISVVPRDIRAYATPSTIVDRPGTIELIEDLSRALADARERARARERCLRGSTHHCVPSELLLSQRSVAASPPLTRAQTSVAEQTMRAARAATFTFDSELGERLIRLSESACLSPDAAKLFAVRAARTFLRAERLIPLYVGDWYLLEIPEGHSLAQVPYLESFLERGMRYVPMHALVYYECPGGALDQGEVLATRAVAIAAAHDPFSRSASDEARTGLETLEMRLKASVIEESDAAAYVEAATRRGAMTGEARARAERLALSFAYKDEGLLATIFDIIEAEASNLRLADEGIAIDVSAANLFFTRSGAAGLFLAHHPSIGVALPYAENTLPPQRHPYRLFSELQERGFGTASLRELLRFYATHYEF